jgi:flagellar hook-associated protein 1 FlgK
MSGLLDSLLAATSSLNAQRMGLDVAGQNLANINTVGYTRRTVVLEEGPPSDASSAGTGVSVRGVSALRDQFVEARIQVERNGLQHDKAIADSLSVVETALGQPGASLDASLSSLFDAFTALAQDPTSTVNREAVITQGKAVAAGFKDMASRLTAARQNADAAIRGAVDQVNTLAAQIAKLNQQISTAGTPNSESLIDQRTVLINKLADLTGASTVRDSTGAVDVTTGQGRPLVIGVTAFTLDFGPAGSGGLATLASQGNDITSELTGGQIGGWLKVRDTLVPGYQNSLDQLASDVATGVNSLHNAGFDATGAAGGDFFTPPATVANAAATFSVDAAVAADPKRVAASLTGSVGDNQTAKAIAALRDAVLPGTGATPTQSWAQLVYRVGADAADATASTTTRQQVVDQLGRLRDSTSGVSTDEEAAQLMKYQRAYEASARYFTTIVQTLDALLAMVP